MKIFFQHARPNMKFGQSVRLSTAEKFLKNERLNLIQIRLIFLLKLNLNIIQYINYNLFVFNIYQHSTIKTSYISTCQLSY